MKPGRTNYEIWLIDYLDGTLDNERERELFLFLDKNPDIREELSNMISYKLAPSSGKFINKNSLKKSAEDLSGSQFELMCVAALENDLSEDQRSELDEIVAGNPEKKKTYEQIKRIKLTAPAAEFSYKSRLKKLTIPQKIFRYSAISISTAAAIIILVTILKKPVPSAPEYRILVSSTDTNRIESVEIERTGNTVVSRPELVSENQNGQGLRESENKQDIFFGDIQTGLVSEMTDSASSPAFNHSSEISKIGYHSYISLSNKEFGQSLVAVNLITVPDIEEEDNPGLSGTITKFFREKILKSETQEKGSLKGYEIADAGINGLNRLFGWEMSLEKKTDEKGEVNSVYFNSRLLKFNAPVKKSESLE